MGPVVMVVVMLLARVLRVGGGNVVNTTRTP